MEEGTHENDTGADDGEINFKGGVDGFEGAASFDFFFFF